MAISSGDVELVYDACAQAVLPWSGAAEDWMRDAQALQSVLKKVKAVHEGAQVLPEEIDEKPLQDLLKLAATAETALA